MSTPPAPWEIAKELLSKDILAKRILPTMKPRDVHGLREEHQQVGCKNFRNNLLALKKALQKSGDRAVFDEAALAHDRAQGLHPINPINPAPAGLPALFSYPRWDASEAQRLLKIDVTEGKHNEMQPRELRETRVECQAFPPGVFGKHIQQEVRSRRETPCWAAKRAKKARKAGADAVAEETIVIQ
jgi:hypothetical protein